jgi:hypothetical protein
MARSNGLRNKRLATARGAVLRVSRPRLDRAPAIRGFAFFFWEKRWFFIALAVGLLLIAMPAPEVVVPLDRRPSMH